MAFTGHSSGEGASVHHTSVDYRYGHHIRVVPQDGVSCRASCTRLEPRHGADGPREPDPLPRPFRAGGAVARGGERHRAGGRLRARLPRPCRLPAGRDRQDHVHPCAVRLARHARLHRAGAVRARHIGVAASAGRCRAQGDGADRGGVRLPVPAHRLALGPADVGHLLGVGRAADLDAGAAAALSRLAGPAFARSRIRTRPGARRRC